jgi:flagellar basal-body rod protein FlgG
LKVLLSLIFILPVSSLAMSRALNTAATGMAAQEMNVNAISNNIANVNTIGYKKQRAEFESLMYETVTEAGAKSSHNSRYSTGVQIGSGSKVSGIRREFSPGSPQITNRPFDMMINGDGFFGVVMPNGEIRFTRDGSFSPNAQGTLVTKQGYTVVPTITIPPGISNFNIGQNGTVEVIYPNQVEPQNIGQIPIFTFINPVGLKATGQNLYQPTMSSGEPVQQTPGDNGSGLIAQGTLETSNVSVMNEMQNLIKAQRAYEMNSKVMQISDQMLQTVNTIR